MTTSATRRPKSARRKAAAGKKAAAKKTAAPVAADRQTSLPVPPSRTGAPVVDPQELRRRWAFARQIVREAVGEEEEQDPRIWERGAYQLWLWLVVERLVVRRDQIDVDELSVVSKMIYDQRKLSLEEAKHSRKADDDRQAPANTGRLPPHFGEIVRQIYGTNFQDDCAPTEPTES